jgi:ankyrin repeat protein
MEAAVTSSLPPSPSLQQLRRRAKDLLRALKAGDDRAAARLAAHHPRSPESPRLADAQLVIAREHGFPGWPRLRAYVDRVTAHGPELQHAYRDDVGYHEDRASGLLASAEDGTETAVAAFARWGAPLSQAGARLVVAREHGFPTWAALRRHVASLSQSGEPFARAYRAVEAHDLEALRGELDRFPDLARARGTNGNDLLGMATGTGDERVVALLLERGADPASANAHGWTALHQAAYGGRAELARMLLQAGAPLDASARGDGGTPLIVALFWGHLVPMELVEAFGIHPRNLRAAAGLGLVELIAELVGPDGRLAPEAGAHRGFYRPHGGFPAWRPSDEPKEILDEAVAWAARCDRAEAVEALVARGGDPNADVYRGTPLAWAAACGRVDTIRRLIALGADPNGRTTFGGPDHGEATTPLHLAAESGRIEAIETLLEAGADPTIRDGRHDSTPAGWAEHNGQVEAERLLRGLA